jgi:glucose/arabinose dehydrogenase
LTRVTASGDSAAPNTEAVPLGQSVGVTCKDFPSGADCIPSEDFGHSVGVIRVASDGSLFATFGDASNANFVDDEALRAQNLDSLAGKVVRITTDGKGRSGNPFWNGDQDSNRSKIWAYGVPNGFRFGLQRDTDVPHNGDVGWNNWEEVNVVSRGSNLGWPCYEGSLRQGGYEPKPICQTLYGREPPPSAVR